MLKSQGVHPLFQTPGTNFKVNALNKPNPDVIDEPSERGRNPSISTLATHEPLLV
jgi:hypothetical protein